MRKKLNKKTVLREGYIKGLKEAQRIISEMAEQRDIKQEVWAFGDYQIDKLLSIKEITEDVASYSKQMMDIWRQIKLDSTPEDDIREKLETIMSGYYLIGQLFSRLHYVYVDSGLCKDIAFWGETVGKRDTDVILSPTKGQN